MNVYPDAVLDTVIHNNRKAIPFILTSVFLELDMVYLQMEYIKQDIYNATYNYLVSRPTPDKNILDTADYAINYIKKFLQFHQSYPESTTTRYHLTPGIIAEASATTDFTATLYAPNVSIHIRPLSNSTE